MLSAPMLESFFKFLRTANTSAGETRMQLKVWSGARCRVSMLGGDEVMYTDLKASLKDLIMRWESEVVSPSMVSGPTAEGAFFILLI